MICFSMEELDYEPNIENGYQETKFKTILHNNYLVFPLLHLNYKLIE